MASPVITGTSELSNVSSIPIQSTGDELYSYYINANDYYLNAMSGYVATTADDFTLDGEYTITGFGVYAATTYQLPSILDLKVIIYADGDQKPVAEVWNHHPTGLTFTDSGFSTGGGYTIYYTEQELNNSSQFTTAANTKYWIASFRLDDPSWYMSCGTTVHGSEGMIHYDGEWIPISELDPSYPAPVDMFMVLEGSPLGLENCTWGRVKSIF